MADRTIKSVFQLRGDTLANWEAKNPTLKDREVGIVVVPANAETGLNKPAVLLKVGDGTTAFKNLAYVSALAGDVKEWAKAATKPTYTADEISGLSEYISGEIEDTDTQYKIEQDTSNGHIIRFYSKAKDAQDYSLVTTITTVDTVYDDTELEGRVEDAEGEIDSLKELLGETSVQAQIAAAIAALDLANTYEAKGAAAAVLGTESDTEDKNTVYGAKAAAAAAKTAAEAKVAGVTAGDNSIEVVNTDAKNPKVKVKIDPDEDNALELGEAGLKVTIPEAAKVEVVKKSAATDGYIATYILEVDGEQAGAEINIPKDYLVKSATIQTVSEADKPYSGAKIGDKYIDFVVNTYEGTGNESHIYLAVNELVDTYTPGDGISISDANVVAIKLDSANANGLAVTSAGLKLGLAAPSVSGEGGSAGAMSATDKEKLNGIADGATKVEASQTNGNVKIGGTETPVYTLPTTVLDATDTFVFDGGDAEGNVGA